MRVTFVIATYKRADALTCTLRALQLQGHQDWDAVVVGDCCGCETETAVRSIDDRRISYYNLPQRFGEQSGPNNVGLHLASGDMVAFLNHDDLLLRDHLERALAALSRVGGDLFIGRCANATNLVRINSDCMPVFTQVLPRSEQVDELISPDPYVFDPSSFWLVRTPYARAVGWWRPAARLWRTPLRDWLLRAWHGGGNFCFGDRVTGLRFWTHNLRENENGPLYAHATPELDYMVRRLERESPEQTREFIEEQLRDAQRRHLDQVAVPPRRSPVRTKAAWLSAYYRRRLAVKLFLSTGLDAVVLADRLRLRPRGIVMNRISRRRTGEGLPAVVPLEQVLANAKSYRVI